MTNIFHQHLDLCAQCRNHPLALCEDGSRMLAAAVLQAGGHVLAGTRAAVGELLLIRDVCQESSVESIHALGFLVDKRIRSIVEGKNLPELASDAALAAYRHHG